MNIVRVLIRKLIGQFSLSEDRAREEEIIASIKKGVEFQGVNAWVLVFAIFIASIGLNVNSTAVVIGAMLISPLMGPIMGMGLSVGIFDFALLKKSFTNLAFMVAISLVTSFLYFLVSPISMPSAELMARTTPTIWDVAIAFFGGMAGIVVGSSKEKGNAIPGVAIATALMPPLCTAGYGLATRQFEYFIGAFYLFFINAVMIGFSSVLVVRLLGYKQVTMPDPQQRHRVKRLTNMVVVLTVLPSIWLGFKIVDKNLYESRLNQFIALELNFPNSQPILRKVETKPKKSARILLVGEPVPDATIAMVLEKRSLYKLQNADIQIRQGTNASFAEAMQDSMNVQKNTMDNLLNAKTQHISRLERSIDSLKNLVLPTGQTRDILSEIKAVDTKIVSLSVGEMPIASDTLEKRSWIALIQVKGSISNAQSQTISRLLSARLKKADLQVRFIPVQGSAPEEPLKASKPNSEKPAKSKKKR